MKYQILRGVLIAGVVLGFGSGFAQLGARWAMHHGGQHPHWGQHCRDKNRDRDQTTPDVKPAARTEARPDAKTGVTPAAQAKSAPAVKTSPAPAVKTSLAPTAKATPAPTAFPALAPNAPTVL